MVLRSERGLLGLLAFIYIFSVDAAPIRNLEQQVLSVPGKEAKAADVANGKLGKGGKHKFRNRKMSKDPTGRFHARLRQQVSGVDVFEGDVVAHFDVGGSDVEDMTDATRPVGEVNMIPTLSEADCKAIALDASRKLAVVPSWGQSHEPNEPGNEIFTNQTAELNLYAPDEQHTFLTYKILTHLETLFSQNVHEVKEVTCLVDAHTGDVRKIWDSLGSIRDMVGGTMNTRFSGQRSATVNRVGTSYELRDTSRNVYVSNLGGATSGSPAAYSLGTTVFGDGGSATATALADVYFGMQLTLEYYQVRHGRNGWNNAGGQTFGRAHYGVNYQNAFWTSSCNCFSTGDGLEAVDVIAHEMTHGVIDSEGGLTYSGESGGLNEAYADIFATMVEYYGAETKGSPDAGDYLIGERLTVFGGALRNMANPIPPSVGSWYSGVGNLDVHYSSGIPNRAFYLLAEGGGVCNGIGRTKAADIFYHSLVAYFTSGTTFAQARNYHLQSAQTLYGSTTSPEYVAVACAWAAVKVGDPLPASGSAPCSVRCRYDTLGSRTAESSPAACQRRCQADSSCAFWSYWADGGCHVSGASATYAADSGAQACGSKTCTALCDFGCRYDTLGSRTAVLSPSACQQRCQGDSNCAYWSYWADGGCHVSDASAKYAADSGAQGCGSKSCVAKCASSCQYNTLGSRTEESSAAACQKRCQSDSSCTYFSYWADRGCHVSDASATFQSGSSAQTCGSRTCIP